MIQMYVFINKVRHKMEWMWGNHRVSVVTNEQPRYGLMIPERIKPRVIVSLTTYSKRIDTVHLVVKSLLRQSVKPDKVILYLGQDVLENQIPEQLKELQKFGLEIVTGCEDLKPHKKYYFAMRQNPEDIVITVDDDIVYEKNLLRDLLRTHERHPRAVVCRRANIITRGEDGKLLPYDRWPNFHEAGEKERYDLLPTGAGGVLYPPHALDSMVFDVDALKKYCLNADDIWLRYMGAKLNTPVVYCKPRMKYLAVLPETQKSGLYITNVAANRNDKYLRMMEEQYSWTIDSGKI